eukprot:CAMPEP_0196817364 /NCGR_PEP_ID=MMETSP1362-20130617/60231_1 /TAXON_ID=163516 /ORGANISM="Leptocylindrus danicus, Strain CCMP1856" /LENGTH=347 /DNA_ID=CAMNT_0042195033 /DNA_START=147 /DNA_END=1190 /DNA_ORIENTATION=-
MFATIQFVSSDDTETNDYKKNKNHAAQERVVEPGDSASSYSWFSFGRDKASASYPIDYYELFENNTAPIDIVSSGGGYIIPRHMLFTYKKNLLKTKTPEVYYSNTLNTIHAYKEAWNVEQVPVYFLDNEACEREILLTEPKLLKYFLVASGEYKADICRIAALYRHGGYYFDVDLEVIEPIALGNNGNVSFVTVQASGLRYFFQAFIAVSPKNFILKLALQSMLNHYEGTRHPATKFEHMGPSTLKEAFDATPHDMMDGKSLILEEFFLDNFGDRYPEMTRYEDNGWGACNAVVHDKVKHVVHFRSRVFGSDKCNGDVIAKSKAESERRRDRVSSYNRFGDGHIGPR